MLNKTNPHDILGNNRLNKGTAFSLKERDSLGLNGLLPPIIENLEQQKQRAYRQFCSYNTNIEKHNYLYDVFTSNAVLFFALVQEYLGEMLPIIYTPTIAEAVMRYSRDCLRQTGIIITPSDLDKLEKILRSLETRPSIAVVTDGRGVLGIGDQGIGGLKIAIGKLMVYTLIGRINPFDTLAIQLDTGTDNEDLLADPLYLGTKTKRLSDEEYIIFLDRFIEIFKKSFPDTILHWEDFGRRQATTILQRYEYKLPSFNDDIQGTGAVVVAALLTAIRKSQIPSDEHKICIFGAGTAGVGIADQICTALSIAENKEPQIVRERLFLIDKQGLLNSDDPELLDFQRPYAKNIVFDTDPTKHLEEVVSKIKPTVLIGCSACKGAFNADIIRQMKRNSARPVIMVLSNPSALAEASPELIIKEAGLDALIATGTAYGAIGINDLKIKISQCNNALLFPGIALGMLIAKARRLSAGMLYAASRAVFEFFIDDRDLVTLLPDISDSQKVSQLVALAVAKQAVADGIAGIVCEQAHLENLKNAEWRPDYLEWG